MDSARIREILAGPKPRERTSRERKNPLDRIPGVRVAGSAGLLQLVASVRSVRRRAGGLRDEDDFSRPSLQCA